MMVLIELPTPAAAAKRRVSLAPAPVPNPPTFAIREGLELTVIAYALAACVGSGVLEGYRTKNYNMMMLKLASYLLGIVLTLQLGRDGSIGWLPGGRLFSELLSGRTGSQGLEGTCLVYLGITGLAG